MNEIDLLNDDKYELPKDRDDGEIYFEDFLKKLYEDYLYDIRNLKPTSAIGSSVQGKSQKIKEITDGILLSIQKYLSGQPSKAYSILDGILSNNSNLLNQLVSRNLLMENIGVLYKLRESDKIITNREDIFHVPFDLRHKISTYRYSIPGYPCLYLGGSLYVCWEELNKPDDFSKLYLSAYKIDDTVRVLNFGYRPAEIATIIEEKSQHMTKVLENFCHAYLMLWPLIAACSIRVLNEGPFKVEYIIPQLLLQWISNERSEIDGIRYFSTKVVEYINNPKINCNFAFPVKSVASHGFCTKMKVGFKLTEPKNCKDLKSEISPHHTDLGDNQLPPIIDGSSRYTETEFARIESLVNTGSFMNL